MPEVCTNLDKHIGHAKPRNPFHKTPYIASQDKVNAQGGFIITQGDSTACGDPVAAFSSKVKIGGKGVHRKGDATSGHEGWVPNSAASGRSKVKAG